MPRKKNITRAEKDTGVKRVMAKEEPPAELEEEEPPIGGIRATYNCPLCGLRAETFANSKNPSIPALDNWPHNFGTWLKYYGGFRYDVGRRRHVGRIKYMAVPEPIVPMLKFLLALILEPNGVTDALIEQLHENKVPIPDDHQSALTFLGSSIKLWASVVSSWGEVNK